MAMRFGLNSAAKTLGLSRPFSAMISLSKTLSLSRPSFRHLSLSTTTTANTLNLSHRPLCVFLSLSFFSSLSAPGQKKKLTFERLNGEDLSDDEVTWRTSLKVWERSYFSPELNELLDTFDRKTTYAWEMTEELRKEYNMKLDKLFEETKTKTEDEDEDEDEYDDYLLADVKELQNYFWNIIFNRSEAFYLGKSVNKVLDWFEKEMTNAKEINEKLRKDLEMMILKANKKDEEDLQQQVEELAEMYWTLSINQAKAIRAKEAAKPAAAPNNNLPWYLKSKPVETDWQANDFIVLLNELLVWFEKETMEANETTQKLRKEYETFIAKLSAEERAADGEAGGNPWRRCFKELENMLWNLKKKQSKALVSKAKANKLADHQAMAAKLLCPFFVMALSPLPRRQKKLISDSVNELLNWFDNEAMEANDTIQKLRKEYEIIVATLLAEDRAVLMEDVEDLQDFNWELSVKSSQASDVIEDNELSSGYLTKAESRSQRTDITGRNWITWVWEKHVSDNFDCLEDDMIKVREKIEKLRKDHEMMAQKLLLANDEEDEAVLVEELNEMFSNLSENKAKAIQAKANAAKAHDHKARAADLLSCFFVF